LNLTELSATGKRDFRHLLSAQDQQLAALSVDIGAKGIDLGADVDRVIARLDTSMDTAIALGTKLICVDLGPLPAPPLRPKPQKKITADEAGLIFLPPPSMGLSRALLRRADLRPGRSRCLRWNRLRAA